MCRWTVSLTLATLAAVSPLAASAEPTARDLLDEMQANAGFDWEYGPGTSIAFDFESSEMVPDLATLKDVNLQLMEENSILVLSPEWLRLRQLDVGAVGIELPNSFPAQLYSISQYPPGVSETGKGSLSLRGFESELARFQRGSNFRARAGEFSLKLEMVSTEPGNSNSRVTLTIPEWEFNHRVEANIGDPPESKITLKAESATAEFFDFEGPGSATMFRIADPGLELTDRGFGVIGNRVRSPEAPYLDLQIRSDRADLWAKSPQLEGIGETRMSLADLGFRATIAGESLELVETVSEIQILHGINGQPTGLIKIGEKSLNLEMPDFLRANSYRPRVWVNIDNVVFGEWLASTIEPSGQLPRTPAHFSAIFSLDIPGSELASGENAAKADQPRHSRETIFAIEDLRAEAFGVKLGASGEFHDKSGGNFRKGQYSETLSGKFGFTVYGADDYIKANEKTLDEMDLKLAAKLLLVLGKSTGDGGLAYVVEITDSGGVIINGTQFF